MKNQMDSKPPYLSDEAWDKAGKELLSAFKRELDFFARHGFPDYQTADESGMASAPHKAWVKVTEHEYNKMSTGQRVMCDSPMARMMFVLGWLTRDATPRSTTMGVCEVRGDA